ncbi:MAG TPA: hypothetical protein DCY85_03880 [Firmicutes bacterium]|jgi:hypothetical protein|nr:hypothetical protein [Bacillota bacterium]HBE05609.1 hypothetical protein [Bacillota bacterium]HBR23423.1 hypothetical protein [Bacillota bacterium]HCF90849.1 hypothetical protein [Bacillota bacterium]
MSGGRKIKAVLIIGLLLAVAFAGYHVEAKNGAAAKFKTYSNDKFKFSLQFPVSWDRNYVIHQQSSFLEISFLGNSKAGKNYHAKSKKNLGLTMFYIGTHDYVTKNKIAGAQQIGVSRDVKFYFFLNARNPINTLLQIYNNPKVKDKNEKKQALDDYKRAKEMEKDIKAILKSFRAK